MAKEIERKFLVTDDRWRAGAVGVPYRQGYLPTLDGCTVRVREAGGKGFLTIKGPTRGLSRDEYEYTKLVGYELGLRGLDICTGCGPGAMKGPMKGAARVMAGSTRSIIRDPPRCTARTSSIFFGMSLPLTKLVLYCTPTTAAST